MRKMAKTALFLVQSLLVLFVHAPRFLADYEHVDVARREKEGSKNTDRAIHDIRDERMMIAVQKVATKPKICNKS